MTDTTTTEHDRSGEPEKQDERETVPPAPPTGWEPYGPPAGPVTPAGWEPYAPPPVTPAGWEPYGPPSPPVTPAGWEPYSPPPVAPTGWEPYGPPPRLAPSGNGPVTGGWVARRAVTHLWSSSESPGVWINVHGIGWKRLSPASDSGHSHLTLLALLAKNHRLPVSYHEDSRGQIDQLVV